MKAQKPAEGIMLTHKFDDALYYRVDCTCGNPDDQIEVCIEFDDEVDCATVSFYTTQKTEWWKTLADWEVHKIDNSWLYSIVNATQEFVNGFYQRLRITRDVWIHGYVKYSSHVILTNQQAYNFSRAVTNSVNTLEKRKKK